MRTRDLLLRCAVLAMILAAAFLVSPRFVQQAYATYAGCTATCGNGSCGSDPEEGETCTCGCTWYGTARCTCTQAVRPSTSG
jgi:hypothetical protein